MNNPYDVKNDPMFQKFFKHLLKPEVIMESEEYPAEKIALPAMYITQDGEISIIVRAWRDELIKRLDAARKEQDDMKRHDSRGYDYWKGAGDSLQALIDKLDDINSGENYDK